MLGSLISCTVWGVRWRHLNLEPQRVVLFPGERSAPAPVKMVEGELLVTTSDPSGADLCDVVRSLVLGAKATPAHEFALLHVHRVGDVRGLARCESDVGAPIDNLSAAMIIDAEGQRGRLDELDRELLLAEAALTEERAKLRAVVAAAQAIREAARLLSGDYDLTAYRAYSAAAEFVEGALGIANPDERADTLPPPAPSEVRE